MVRKSVFILDALVRILLIVFCDNDNPRFFFENIASYREWANPLVYTNAKIAEQYKVIGLVVGCTQRETTILQMVLVLYIVNR